MIKSDFLGRFRDAEKMRSWAREYLAAGYNEHKIDDVMAQMMADVEIQATEFNDALSVDDAHTIANGIRYALRYFIDLDRGVTAALDNVSSAAN